MIVFYKLLRFLGIAILIVPILYSIGTLFSAQKLSIPLMTSDLFWVFTQAILSASLSLLFGVLGCVSIICLNKGKNFILYFGLLPQVFPSLLMIFAYVNALSFINIFPQSYAHVIVVHTLINIGLVSFLLYQPLQESMQRKLHLYASLKLHPLKYIFLLLRGEVKAPVFYIWTLVFSYCLSSFSIPLVLSGDRATSFEFLIYKNGFIDGRWDIAAFWGLLQVLIIALLFKTRPQALHTKQQANVQIIKFKWPFFVLGLVASGILVFSFIPTRWEGFSLAIQQMQDDMEAIALNTIFLSLWTLFFYSLYFWSTVIFIRHKLSWTFYQKFWPLSPILLGLYMMSFAGKWELELMGRLILTALVLASFIFPVTFKFWLWPKFKKIQILDLKIKVLGLTEKKAIGHILVQFFLKDFWLSLGFVLLFVIGDFAISSILLSDVPTLGLSIKNYILKYQLVEAQILSLILSAVAVGLFFIFGGKSVFNSKL